MALSLPRPGLAPLGLRLIVTGVLVGGLAVGCGSDEPVRKKARPFPTIVLERDEGPTSPADSAEREGSDALPPGSDEAPSEPPGSGTDAHAHAEGPTLHEVDLGPGAGGSPALRARRGGRQVRPLTGTLPPDRRFRLHALDVGQGSATLLEFPCAAVLVDTGGEKNELFDGPAALEAELERFFAGRPDLERTLSLVLLTHPHIDHLRGLPRVLERYRVLNLVDNGFAGDKIVEAEMKAKREFVEKNRGRVGYRGVTLDEVPRGGLTDKVIDPVACPSVDPKLTVLFGGLKKDPGWGNNFYGDPRFDNQNNHSVVLRVDFGDSSVLITGDLEEIAIEELVERQDGLLDVDLYVVGHHGSHNGTTRELVEEMTPGFAVISMGPPSREVDWTAWRYGHPRAGIVTLLANSVSEERERTTVKVARYGRKFDAVDVDTAVFATGWDGTVVFEASDDGRWRTVRPPPASARRARAAAGRGRGGR